MSSEEGRIPSFKSSSYGGHRLVMGRRQVVSEYVIVDRLRDASENYESGQTLLRRFARVEVSHQSGESGMVASQHIIFNKQWVTKYYLPKNIPVDPGQIY